MRKMKIVADSSADVLLLDGVEYAFAPLKILTSEREYVDNVNLDVDEMVKDFEGYKGKSSSSCPNTGDWLEVFDDADDVFCVTITSGLSGSYNSACAAKQVYESEHPGKRVFVLDTLSAGPEIRLIVEKLAEYVRAGLPYEEICSQIEAYRKHTGLLFMLKSLKNFANNGRVSPTVAKLVGFLGICIVGKASDEGTLEPMHKCRGEKNSLEHMVADLEDLGYNGGKICITHCMNETAAQQMQSLIRKKFGDVPITVARQRGLCSFYAEKGGILLGFEKKIDKKGEM